MTKDERVAFVGKMLDDFVKERSPAQIVALNTDDVEAFTDEVLSTLEKDFVSELRKKAKELATTGAVEDDDDWGWEVR